MSGRIDFEFAFNNADERISRSGNRCYRTYILGNFSGRSDLSWDQRKITAIDIDSFEQAMAKIGSSLQINNELALSFESLEDFHPDAWIGKIPILADLLELKAQLGNPATAEQAAAKIKAFLPNQNQAASPSPVSPATDRSETDEQTLERLLGKKPDTTSAAKTDTVDRLVQQIMSPYVSKETEPQHHMLIDVIDETIAHYLRMLLQRQDFRCLETLWRSTAELVCDEGGDEHRFFLVDISQVELQDALGDAAKGFEQKLLAHIRTADGEQDVLLLGDYYFSESSEDGELLSLLGRLANTCEGYFLGAATASLLEHAVANGREWKQYLNNICADRVMLTYPRYLSRLPYGVKRDPLETLRFEECAAIPQTGELAWGNSAFLVARALIRVRQRQDRNESLYFNDIPCFSYHADGEQMLQAGIETILTENQADAVISQGVIPVIGYHQRQGGRLIGLFCLADAS